MRSQRQVLPFIFSKEAKTIFFKKRAVRDRHLCVCSIQREKEQELLMKIRTIPISHIDKRYTKEKNYLYEKIVSFLTNRKSIQETTYNFALQKQLKSSR